MSFDVPNLTTYPSLSGNELLTRLSYVVTELIDLHDEIGMIEAQEVRDKATVMQQSGETSSSGRHDRVNMTVVEPVATGIELRARREALVEEKFFIIRILETRLEVREDV